MPKPQRLKYAVQIDRTTRAPREYLVARFYVGALNIQALNQPLTFASARAV